MFDTFWSIGSSATIFIINKIIEDNGLRIIAQKRLKLSVEQAKKFYEVHKEKFFYNDLIV